MSRRASFRVAIAGLDPRDLRLVEIVFRHSPYNRYEYALLERFDAGLADVAIVNLDAQDGQRALAELHACGRVVPVIAAVARGGHGKLRFALSIERLTLQLLPVLNRVVEIELAARATGCKAVPDAPRERRRGAGAPVGQAPRPLPVLSERLGEFDPDAIDDKALHEALRLMASIPPALHTAVDRVMPTGEPGPGAGSAGVGTPDSAAAALQAACAMLDAATSLLGAAGTRAMQADRGSAAVPSCVAGGDASAPPASRSARAVPASVPASVPLPAVAQRRPRRDPAEGAASEDGRLLRALVVDDSAAVRQQLAYALGRIGLAAETAANGQEALRLLAERHVDLVTIDLGLPDIDGYTTIRALRSDERWRRLPIVVLSSHASPLDVARSLLAGASVHLAKPVTLTELQRVVQAQLRRSLGVSDLSTWLAPARRDAPVARAGAVTASAHGPSLQTADIA